MSRLPRKAGRRICRGHVEPDRLLLRIGGRRRRIPPRLVAPRHPRLAQIHAAFGTGPRIAPQRVAGHANYRRRLRSCPRRMVAVTEPGRQLHGHRGAGVTRWRHAAAAMGRGSLDNSAIGGRDPGNPAKADALVGQFPRILFAGLAIDAMRVDFTIMDPPGFLGKAVADVITMRLDLPTHLEQRRPELRRGDRRSFPRARQAWRHHRLFYRRIAAFRARNLAGLLLCLEAVPVTKPPLEFMAVRTAQREQDHRDNLLAGSCTPANPARAIIREYGHKP